MNQNVTRFPLAWPAMARLTKAKTLALAGR